MTRRTRTSPALVVLAIAGLLLGPGTPAWSAGKASRTHKKTAARHRAAAAHRPAPVTDVATAHILLDAQAAYEAAQSQYNARRFDEAAKTLDPVINLLGDAMSGGRDARLRREAGDLFKKCGSLNLAAVRRRDAELALPPAGDVTKAAQNSGNSAADSALALASAPPPADRPDLPLPNGDDPDENALALPAIEDGPNAIALESHPMVDKWLDYFTGRGRPTFERWLTRSGLYMDSMKKTLEREGVPTDLVHLVFVESGFNPQARSYAAAVGPWQFIRGTAKMFGLTMNSWVDERKDPEASTVAAARYLKHLYGLFNSWPLALASYNAGEGTVLRAIKAQGSTNYWDLRLPRQTEDYVPQFMAALAISRDPVKYGFDSVELDDPMAFDEIALKGAVDLRTVARLAGCSYEELRDLNPAVLRGAATSRSGITTLRVPQGKGEVLLKQLQDGATLPAVNLTIKHKVKRGETLEGIARQYSVSAREIARVNSIGRKRPLRRGMVLTVPASLRARTPVLAEAGDPRASTDYVPARTIGIPASLVGSSTADGRVNVTVRKGETLQMIADRNSITVADIMRWNHLKSTHVRRGTRLKLRTGDVATAQIDSSAAEAQRAQIAKIAPPRARHSASRRSSHRGRSMASAPNLIHVRAGDTLTAIALRHGVSVAALKRANGGSSRVRAGQRLRLPSS